MLQELLEGKDRTMKAQWTKFSLSAICETVRLWAGIRVMMHLVIPLVSVWVVLEGVRDLCSDHLCSGDERMFPHRGTSEVAAVCSVSDFLFGFASCSHWYSIFLLI